MVCGVIAGPILDLICILKVLTMYVQRFPNPKQVWNWNYPCSSVFQVGNTEVPLFVLFIWLQCLSFLETRRLRLTSVPLGAWLLVLSAVLAIGQNFLVLASVLAIAHNLSPEAPEAAGSLLSSVVRFTAFLFLQPHGLQISEFPESLNSREVFHWRVSYWGVFPAGCLLSPLGPSCCGSSLVLFKCYQELLVVFVGSDAVQCIVAGCGTSWEWHFCLFLPGHGGWVLALYSHTSNILQSTVCSVCWVEN